MNALEVKHLTKKFGGITAVNDVSFSVEKGKILGLIGPNGAGKTTCFNMIAGYYPPSSGDVYLTEEKVTGKKPYQLNKIGLSRTFQIVKPLGKLSVLDNIMVASLSKSRNIAEARENAEKVLNFTELNAIKDTISSQLSIGNLKKMEVARSIATKPKILLLDEPMGGLSPSEVEEAIILIKKINESGITVVIIEHNMKVITSIADSIVVLQNGNLIANGQPEEVMNNPNVIKAYLGDGYKDA